MFSNSSKNFHKKSPTNYSCWLFVELYLRQYLLVDFLIEFIAVFTCTESVPMRLMVKIVFWGVEFFGFRRLVYVIFHFNHTTLFNAIDDPVHEGCVRGAFIPGFLVFDIHCFAFQVGAMKGSVSYCHFIVSSSSSLVSFVLAPL